MQTDAAAMEYAGYGWLIVPIETKSKNPGSLLGGRWQRQATCDEEKIAAWWEQWPDANIGLVLGPRSGVIDVEYDDDEGKATLKRLLPSDSQATPSYQSFRSIHRLYRWDSRYGDCPGTKKIAGVEFRLGSGGKAIQSVVPPSVHPDGGSYRWLPGLSPSEVELLPLPEPLVRLLIGVPQAADAVGRAANTGRRPKSHWDAVTSGVAEGGRTDAATSLAGILIRNLRDIYDESAVHAMRRCIEAVNDRNDPPMQGAELHKHVDGILRAESERRAAEDVEERVNPKTPTNMRRDVLRRQLGGLPLVEIKQRGREDTDFVFLLDSGREVFIGPSLLNQDRVREAILYATSDFSPCIAVPEHRKQAWRRIVAEMLDCITTVIDIEGEARYERVTEWVARHIADGGEANEKGWNDAIATCSPVKRDGRWNVHVGSLMRYIKIVVMAHGVDRKYVTTGMSELGWGSKRYTVRDSDGNAVCRAYRQEPELPAELPT